MVSVSASSAVDFGIDPQLGQKWYVLLVKILVWSLIPDSSQIHSSPLKMKLVIMKNQLY
jgi:hypothetical protein